jgi:hypothetical protein
MITYLLTSILLSCVGLALYWSLIRHRATLRQQRYALHVVIIGSLLLPLLVPSHIRPDLPAVTSVAPLHFGAALNPTRLKQYCRCESPDYTHRIRYRANASYNFLLAHTQWLGYGTLLAVGLVFLLLVLEIGYLFRLVGRTRHQDLYLDGHRCTLLMPARPLGIGAFWLGRSYIIWQEPLTQLSEAERQAIYRHELSHLRQGNTVEKALLRLVQCLWWMNPAFYLLRKELDLLSEFIADRCASQRLGGIKPYANLLLKVKLLQAPPATSALTGSLLRRRIEQLVQPRRERPRLGWLGVGFLVLGQFSLVSPLTAQVDQTLGQLRTYEEIYHHAPTSPEVLYCPDCESVCLP